MDRHHRLTALAAGLTLTLGLLAGCGAEEEPIAETPPDEMGNVVQDEGMREQFRNSGNNSRASSGDLNR
ncbi:MAG: hypothetical protein ACOCX1_01930 [Fimbriimonadaceae bacterium]